MRAIRTERGTILGNNNFLVQFANPYFTALFTGIAAGISYCSISCAPFMSTYIMGLREGAFQGFKSFVIFTAGRIFMCGVLGLASGYMGATLINTDVGFRYVSIIYSMAMVSIGLMMFIPHVYENCRAEKKSEAGSFFSKRLAFSPVIHLLVMGMIFAIIPCPPMIAVLINSLRMPSAVSSSILMLLFGIGITISPLVIVSVLAGWFSKKIKTKVPQYKMLFQKLSGVILILLGVCCMFGQYH